MKTAVICLLDKEYPPEHSFIDGMLAGELPKQGVIDVLLITSKGRSNRKVHRYGRAVCLPLLWRRRGLMRFANIFRVVCLLHRLVNRTKERGSRVVLFVRNEPVYLLCAWFFRNRVDRILFQQSFPHEQSNSLSLKRIVAVWIFRLSAKRVHVLLAVSLLGLNRLRNYFGHRAEGMVIPLLVSRTDFLPSNIAITDPPDNQRVRFVYTGTLDRPRQMEVVLQAIVHFNKSNQKAVFDFIGGEHHNVERLRALPGVTELERNGVVRFSERLPRRELLRRLGEYHVGLSLIPPVSLYREASPTKLSEYMCRGLAVLATAGIPFQEKVIKESEGGILAHWSVEAISDAMIWLCENRAQILDLRRKALTYARTHLDYSRYVDSLISKL